MRERLRRLLPAADDRIVATQLVAGRLARDRPGTSLGRSHAKLATVTGVQRATGGLDESDARVDDGLTVEKTAWSWS
jgi:hypothetical protein